ncbi:MAG: site-specific DNA-methyltransferase [Bacteroidetes bacterium]|nr:site-specific DNA-methyltransferase [Bacteroidota bacterium]
MGYKIISGNCLEIFRTKNVKDKIHLTFLDPPFNQGKEYSYHEDLMESEDYWKMMKEVCENSYYLTEEGGAIYFMQREKNTEAVLKCLRESKWSFQNLIIWKKKTSAVPGSYRYGKQFQVIVFATKGERPRVFNKLRISPPMPANYKYERENGMYVTDVWDDIRELTSGYFAGNEALRDKNGERIHKQQSPIALLLRIILSSSKVGDTIFDPFAGTGTTLSAALQLQRNSIGIEIDPLNVACIKERLENISESDLLQKYYSDYIHTENLSEIWGDSFDEVTKRSSKLTLFGN